MPQRRAAGREVGAVGLGCMGMTWAYRGADRDDARSLAWVLAQDERIVPIPGTTRVERVEESAGAAFLGLDADDLAALDAIPAPVGAHY